MGYLYLSVLLILGLDLNVFAIRVSKTSKHLNVTGCPANQFSCDRKCYKMNQYCNGIKDCEDSSDEPDGCIPIPEEMHCLHGHFTCKRTHRCIPLGWVCDGEVDCGPTDVEMDSSDEEDCHKNIPCPWNQGRCGNTADCRPLSLFCDGERDCPNGADEFEFCIKPMCDKAQCSHGCKPTADGPLCFCPDGYRPGRKGTVCVDADECQLDNTCEQICTNTVGSYKCSCVSGYKMENESCIGINVPNDESPSILFSTLNTIQRITPEGSNWSNYSKLNLLNSHALEFSHRNRTFFYIHHNVSESMFMAVNVDNFTERWPLPKPAVFNNLDTIQQIALDWLTGNWYFLDDEREIILLCNNTLKWCTLVVDNNLDKGRAIALNPMIGFMYFSKWGMSAPVIERCKMDGSEREVLVDRKIVYPYGVMVDYATNNVYWLDTYLDVIEKVSFDGKNRRTVMKGPMVQNLYGISIFENSLYVTSWKDNTVLKINKKSLSTQVIKANISRPFYIHVFHRQRQPDVAHPCRQNNGNCTHICVTNWNNGIAIPKCLCSAGYTLQKNGKCTMTSSSLSLIIAKTQPPLIQAIELENGTETMIPISGVRPIALEVNVHQKTMYYSEANSASIYTMSLDGTNKKEIFSNGGGKCVSLAYDWMGGNLYWADQIGNMGSISVIKLSDTSKKRILISDYKMYPSDIALNPKKGVMYWIDFEPSSLVNGTIYTSWMDGTHKEIFVSTSVHSTLRLAIDFVGKRLYWCSPLNRIESIDFNKSDRKVVVDGLDTAFTIAFYNRNLFYTHDLNLLSYDVETKEKKTLMQVNPFVVEMKIFNTKGQTGVNHCSNTSDCKEICLLIPKSVVCVCPDGFNFVNSTCIKSLTPICQADQFRCKANNRCIPKSLTCNGINDCGDGSDESVEKGGPCGEKVCSADEFSCANKTDCISLLWMCDGDVDCDDGMDEDPANCPENCSPDQFRCAVSKRCISNSWKCDGFMDCGVNDTSDETDCKEPKCDLTEFTCKNSRCISMDLYCDGVDDCKDGSDERDCFDCHSEQMRCNGHIDCPDGSDEKGCTQEKIICADNMFACGDIECIPKIFVCDSLEDCSDGSDELNCDSTKLKNKTVHLPSPNFPNCEHPSRTCDNGTNCITVDQLCNGKYDCDDRTDEGMRCDDKQCSITSICSHICHNAPEGSVCSCPADLHLQPDKIHCLETHPCESWGVCSQKCTPVGSRYKCVCRPGYTLTDDGFTCKSESNVTAFVIFSNRHEVRSVDIHSFNVRSLISSLKNTIALDFYYSQHSNMIFWTDVIDDKIYRGTLLGNSLSSIEVVVQTGLATAEGLAVDWIGENLYWSESKLDQIEVAKLNGSFRRTLVGGEMDNPRAIAVDPRKGYLFWTDWDNDAPRIERCSLAGLDRKIIVQVDQVSDGGWPNGLTLDYDTERIYWIDARSDSIHTSNYDGLDHREVMRNHDMLSHPFAITLFENYVYWTDWRTNSVVRANKWTGGEVFVIQRTLSQPFDIEILHPSRQPRDGINPCGNNNGGCSHLCLIHTNHTYRCDCPHVMRLHTDNKTCVVNERVLLIARLHEIRGVDLQQPYYHMMPTISVPEVMHANQLEYFSKNSTIYWADSVLNEIKRSGLTIGPIQTIIDTGIKHATGLALDWLANLLFVGSLHGITVYNLAGEYSSVIIKDTHVSSVAVDPMRGELYWISLNETNYSVEMSLMDGSERKTLVTDTTINVMSCLGVDRDDNRLYWISRFGVSYYDLSNSTVNKLNLPSQSAVIAMTTYKGLIYYADDNDHSIHSADKTTGENDTVLRNSTSVLSLRVYDPAEQKGHGPCNQNKNGCDHLCVPMSSTESRCICATGYNNDPNDPKRCLGVPEFIFYSKSWEINGLKINGTFNEMETLGPISRVSMANAVDYLAAEDLIFWVDSERGTISSIKRDGTNRKVIVDQQEGIENVASDILTGIAVDWSARNLYWADIRHGVIEVSRIDGSSRYIVISQDIGKPSSLAVDPHKGVLVWGGGSKLEIARLDGSDRKTLIHKALLISDLSLDSKSEHIYFCDSGSHTIERIGYNGLDRVVLLNSSNPYPISLTFWNDMLYWLDGSLSRGYLKAAPIQNLSNFSTLLELDQGDTLKDIQVFSLSRQQTKNRCVFNNGGCQHLCLFNGTYPLCICPHGKVGEDGTSCEDYESVIMFSKVLSIDSIHIKDTNVQNTPYPSIRNTTFVKNAIGLAFNYEARRLFYSDIQRGSINSVFFNGTDHRILVEKQGSVEGLTYEEVYNTLYWTCNNEATISSANLTKFGTRAGPVDIVIKLRSQDKPRGIAVDSCGGRLYWTNWNSFQPAIERAYLSGYDRHAIISTEIRMPNGITLDHKAQKLYWSDARLDKIERCEYDGTKRVVLAKVTPQHPFALAVYGDFIYWTDWVLHAVLRADKLTGLNVVWLRRDVEKPMGIIAVANDTNDCLKNPCFILNGGCEGNCSLTASGEVKCTCEEGYTLAEDGTRCYINKNSTCTGDSFRCSDGGCVPFELTCDTIKHCTDGSDEEAGYCGHRTCPQGWFMCTNRRCIQSSNQCNGIDECGDSSDELNCSCPEAIKFKCGSGECIPRNFTCDRDPDCRDASDEMNCEPRDCAREHDDEAFVNCGNTTSCIHQEWICDGENDCWDMSDEANCPKKAKDVCMPYELQCSRSGKCISFSKLCDKVDDCGDGQGGLSSDEENCFFTPNGCNSLQFMCNDSTCLPASVRCNGRIDCLDGSDEENCTRKCRSSQFTCNSGECIPTIWQCDGQPDCNDGSDEMLYCQNRSCAPHQFRCNSGQCISKVWLCDGEPDCKGEEDEKGCHPEYCELSEFQCADGSCIPAILYCNGQHDCGDKSDEPEECTIQCDEGQFQCAYGRCISQELVCNKKKDCIDGSDEEVCHTLEDNCKDKYKCTNGLCIDTSDVCDGENNCGDYSDEKLCNINECTSNENICMHNCTDKLIGFECSCFDGYKLNPDKPGKCIDIDECEDRPCSQLCRNLAGSYKCSCTSNYLLASDNRTCTAVTTEAPKIIVANRYYIRQVDLTGHTTLLAHNLTNAVGLDFDWKSNCYFWSDVALSGSKIRKLCSDTINGTIITLHGPTLQNPDGLAVDWVGRNLYWCDKSLDTIEVSTMEGKFRRILITEGLEEPRAIALHPLKGYMYWSDWGSNVHIGKANMDGTNREVLIDKNLGWPNALTIDYETEEIFWADAREDYIAVSDLHGKNIRVIAERASMPNLKLHHVFAITIWEDRLYWSDWETKSIESCHKYYGNDTKTLLTTVHRPMDLRVRHPFRQPQRENPCDKSNCSALCLLTSEEPFYKCVCPENYVLGTDGKSCTSNCTSVHFECTTSYKCIPFWWKCDTQNDCDDGSDEPPDCRKFNCHPGQFQCDNEKCIHPSEICNGKDNCGDQTDERNCYNYTCLNTQFRCKGNSTIPPRCISITDRCNKIPDCPFEDDEIDCQPATCASNHFQCQNSHCVPQVWVCDGEADCKDNSDEIDCANRTCIPNHFRCTNGRCIPNSWQCDGDQDCPDGADEPESCRTSDYHTCEPSYYKCQSGKCIPGRWRCDYDKDCDDGSDEWNCTMRNCSESEHRCGNGKCVPGTAVCDGQYQCEDKSDEVSCDPKCGDNEFQCSDPKLCIYINWRCDGEIDCADASDELNCTITCENHGFKCDNGLCINEQWVCDGQDDCGNKFDEGSELCLNRPCLPNYYRCSNHLCIPMHQVCDGVNNCGDNSEEVPYLCHSTRTCRSHEFKCSNGHCINTDLVCDGQNDCLDNSDEIDCTRNHECKWNTCSQICVQESENKTACKCTYGYQHNSEAGCSALGEPATLILAVEAELRLISPYKVGEPNQLYNKAVLATLPRYKVGAIDIYSNPKQLTVFCTNHKNRQVQSINLYLNSDEHVVTEDAILTVVDKLKDPRGLAVDWVTKKIYITDTHRILVSTFNGSQTFTLISGNMKQSRDIVVAPSEGLMFWADWGPVAIIETSHMDGNQRQVLIKHDIIWPTGLAIDYPTKRLYWADPKTNCIGSTNFDGTKKEITHLFNSEVKPFKIDVFEDYIYFTTYRTNNVFRYHKHGKDNGTYLAMGLARLYDIQIFQEHRQTQNVTNRCIDACHSSEICLLNPNSFTCVCPDRHSKTNFTCQAIPEKCPLNCNLGKCIKIGKDAKCECPPTYSGHLCEHYRCSHFCHNKGMCYVDLLLPDYPLRCNCPPQYTGEQCEIPVTVCKDKCYNGGTCYSTHPGSSQCSCRPGFFGSKCQHCSTLMCHNGGVCTKESGKPVCNCPLGYKGETCDIFVCDNYCGKNGNCVATPKGPICRCNPGHGGTRCEKDLCTQKCLNGGTCIMGIKQFECKCPPLFTGRRCQTNLCLEDNPSEECEKTCSCKNGGKCVTRERCNCSPEWTGKHCEVYISGYNDTRCKGLCRNEGKCLISDLNELFCVCRHPFQGVRCEYSTVQCTPDCLNDGICDITPGSSQTFCKCLDNFEGVACENSKIFETQSSNNQRGNYILVTSLVVIVLAIIIAGVFVYLFLGKRKPFSHERLQENDFNNPIYQDRDAEPFTLDTDRSNNFVNPVYETVYNGTTGVKEEKTGLLQRTSEEAATSPAEGL